MNNNQEYAKYLNNLAENGFRGDDGVCALFNQRFLVYMPTMIPREVYESFEFFSGNYYYPVRSPDPSLTPFEAFIKLRKWKGIYGNERRAWCRHLAEYFSNEK